MAALRQTISAPRFQTYLEAAGFKEDGAMALYLWNAAMGQSFHFPLQAVEVALRNAVNAALCAEFGPDWWSDRSCRAALKLERCAEIDKAAQRIRRIYRCAPHTDQVVASLMFGFWAAMLKKRYNARAWNKHVSLSFPRCPMSFGIKEVSQTANEIQDLRNRIFHHEPLIKRDLSGDYAGIIKMLGWICPQTRDWVRRTSSVPTMLRQRPRV
jgi:hypothetical protein